MEKIQKISTLLNKYDKWNNFKARWAFNRMNYKVEPGIYAIGNPDENSFVFVSANYKLSFDLLRRELGGLNAWIMVLDTKGINVWCAAGKGTFGTDEIVSRIKITGLDKLVNHRKLILPQLGAPGVSAHTVKRLSGFSVIYGPVRASDIKPFLENNMTATKEMRKVKFTFIDRLVLIPVEIVSGFKYLVAASIIFLILSGLNRNGYSGFLALNTGTHSIINLVMAFVAGTVISPLLLPWLPGRSFSFKGFISGVIIFAILFLSGLLGNRLIEIITWFIIITAISSFITMNFTGASTYTSMSGVKKEMRIALPFQIMAGITGLVLFITSRFI